MYKLNIKKIEIENIMDSLIQNPFYTTKDNVLARRIGANLRQLRKEKKLIIANDKRTGETYLALRKSPLALPENVLKIKGKRTTYQFDDFFFL